jgi:hypothetical protein
MKQANAKKIRREFGRLRFEHFVDTFNALTDQAFRVRLNYAWRILIGKKIGH